MQSHVAQQPTGQMSAAPGGLNNINYLQIKGEDEDKDMDMDMDMDNEGISVSDNDYARITSLF